MAKIYAKEITTIEDLEKEEYSINMTFLNINGKTYLVRENNETTKPTAQVSGVI